MERGWMLSFLPIIYLGDAKKTSLNPGVAPPMPLGLEFRTFGSVPLLSIHISEGDAARGHKSSMALVSAYMGELALCEWSCINFGVLIKMRLRQFRLVCSVLFEED